MTKISLDKMEVGLVLKFKGYAEQEDGMTPVLKEGEKIVVKNKEDFSKEGCVDVAAVDDETRVDTIYDDEFEYIEEVEELAEAEGVEEKPKPKKKATKKAKKEPKKEVKEELEEEEQAPFEVEPVEEAKEEQSTEVVLHEEFSPSLFIEEATKTSEKAAQAALKLKENIDTHYYALGGILHAIVEKQLYKEQGYSSFDEYVEENLSSGIKPVNVRAARYFISIYKTFSYLGYSFEDIRNTGIGWSKLREIARIDFEASGNYEESIALADQLIEYAQEHTKNDLQLHIGRVVRGEQEQIEGTAEEVPEEQAQEVEEKTVERMTTQFKFHDSNADLVANAIQEAKNILGSDTDDSQAAYYIFAQWYSNEAGVDVPKEVLLRNLAQKYKIKIIVDDTMLFEGLEDGKVIVEEL